MPEKNLLHVVADTNVLVSALLGKHLRIFLELLRQNRFSLVFSEETFEELIFVLQRPKFRTYLSIAAIHEFQNLLSYHSSLVNPAQKVHICRDQKDNIFLECALHLPADYLVTGDEDLSITGLLRSAGKESLIVKHIKSKYLDEVAQEKTSSLKRVLYKNTESFINSLTPA